MKVQAMKAAPSSSDQAFVDDDLLSAVEHAIGTQSAVSVAAAELRALRALYDSLTPRERQVMGLWSPLVEQAGGRRTPARARSQ